MKNYKPCNLKSNMNNIFIIYSRYIYLFIDILCLSQKLFICGFAIDLLTISIDHILAEDNRRAFNSVATLLF